MKYATSTDEENYNGDFDTLDDALAEQTDGQEKGYVFWAGEIAPPPQPETAFSAYNWLEDVDNIEEYSMDCADKWDCSTREQRAELEDAVRKVIGEWLDRHDLRPKFFCIENAKRYIVDRIEGGLPIVREYPLSESINP